MNNLPSRILETWQAARTARANAHCPYSSYPVGAALRLRDGRIFAGCNVENASYGGTICAERSAICAAVAAAGAPLDIEHLVLITREPAPPCGFCLQVLAEFAGGDLPIWLSTPDGPVRSLSLADLLPLRFNADNLEPRA